MAITETIKHAVGLEAGPSTTASREEMSDARLPIPYRDTCAHLLIPLNRCRHNEYYLPWKCECQYEEFKKRVAKMDELRAAKGGERSN
ncbi:unnamed protein product [Aureobasidium pullulans]|nr:unnamed protein product [Aureobasidium pullulans]